MLCDISGLFNKVREEFLDVIKAVEEDCVGKMKTFLESTKINNERMWTEFKSQYDNKMSAFLE